MPQEGNRMNETIRLRPATINDADILLEWRNDPETRIASHNTAEVQRNDHISWLSRTLSNPDRRLNLLKKSRKAYNVAISLAGK